ncbi:MAG TPA: glycosyltransferase [Gaiellaceae bacterium]|nr:glycosyltransferase [Gaiellaceae bacterium]
MTREILFYSDFPFGFHNTEAEEKMARFAARGWRVVYVEQLGIRNPRPRHLLRVLRPRSPRTPAAEPAPFEVVSPKLVPPRRAPLLDGVNRRWLARQLLRHVEDPRRTVLWVRFPTPELVPLVEGEEWRAVVYEAVDDHEAAPGLTGRLLPVFRAAEARVLARADVVFAWSDPIRERLAERHPNVRLATAAVDLEPLAAVAEAPGREDTALFAGALGFRFDEELAAEVSRLLPEWTLVLAGPADDGAVQALGRLANVRLTGRFERADLPGLLAEASVALIPYRRNPFVDMLLPVKLVEYLAAGRPVVSTPMKGAQGFGDVVRFAAGPAAFAEAVRAAARDDSPEARRRRVERARPYSWEARIDEMEAAIEEASRG